MSMGFSFGGVENALELDKGHGRTASWMYQMPLNCLLWKALFYVMWILPQLKNESRHSFKTNLLYWFMHSATMHFSGHFVKNSVALVSFYKPGQVYRQNVLIISDISFPFLTGLNGYLYPTYIFLFASYLRVLVLLICKYAFSTDDINPCHVCLRLYILLLFCFLILT